MRTMKLWYCLVLFITSEKGVVRGDDSRYLTGYDGLNFTGAHYQFTEYTPDLSVVQMDNSIESLCITGQWHAYDAVNYDPNMTQAACLWRGVGFCWNTSCTNAISSVRYAGSPYGLNDDYYNLYEGTYFRGKEFRGNTNAGNLGELDKAVSSLVVTGQAAWTFFTGVDFTGSSLCVYADKHFTDGVISFDTTYFLNMDELGLPDNSIRSVARGCLSERVLGHPGGEPAPSRR
ncbi:uncharacterized protein LOC108665753 isoform X2 [Hyalella azteca]|uniref:Uncharacterized protein LOC108665753 isoform X2 n=1 Tax=Hyalella azteca TaxID=294128 RepID=A0A8B7N375_HYAAZ|nr:uncharacterized protein LOC108665753 isoform X2 [Hyalella azteca]